MLSGNRILGHVITSQGGHALTNKLLIKFFSDKSNWSFIGSKSIIKKLKLKKHSKTTYSKYLKNKILPNIIFLI